MLSVLCSLYRSEIRLPDCPGLKFEDMDQNQKRRMKRLYDNPASYKKIITKILKSQSINLAPFLNQAVPLHEIDKWKKTTNIPVSVFSYEGKNLVPVRFTTLPGSRQKKHINLLLFSHPDKAEEFHYCCILNVAKFLGKHNFAARKFCVHCTRPLGLNNEDHEKHCRVFHSSHNKSCTVDLK